MDADQRQWRGRLRAGDVEAFAELFRAEVDRVHRVASSICGEQAMAEDVTGETFLTAWRQRSSVADTDEPLGPRLLAIATRQSLNAIRGRRRQHLFLARHGHRLTTAAPDIGPEIAARLDDEATLERTQRALAHLRDREVEVLSLCVWSGLSAREAGRALGVAESTVRSRLFRARARLRSLSEESGEEPRPRRDPARTPGPSLIHPTIQEMP